MLRSDLCDYFDAYIVVKRNITVTKTTFTANDFDAPNNTGDNINATMLQMIMNLMKKNGF